MREVLVGFRQWRARRLLVKARNVAGAAYVAELVLKGTLGEHDECPYGCSDQVDQAKGELRAATAEQYRLEGKIEALVETIERQMGTFNRVLDMLMRGPRKEATDVEARDGRAAHDAAGAGRDQPADRERAPVGDPPVG